MYIPWNWVLLQHHGNNGDLFQSLGIDKIPLHFQNSNDAGLKTQKPPLFSLHRVLEISASVDQDPRVKLMLTYKITCID